MKREELLHSREYWIIQFQTELYEALENYRKKKGINQSQLAAELNFSKGYISQVLHGNFNYKISTLIDMALSIGKVPVFRLEDIETYILDDELGIHNLPVKEQVNLVLNISMTSDYAAYEAQTFS